jgi:hypothetical protein
MYYRRLDLVKSDISYLLSNAKLCKSLSMKKLEFKKVEDFVNLILTIVNDSKCNTNEMFSHLINEYKYLLETKVEPSLSEREKVLKISITPEKRTKY